MVGGRRLHQHATYQSLSFLGCNARSKLVSTYPESPIAVIDELELLVEHRLVARSLRVLVQGPHVELVKQIL